MMETKKLPELNVGLLDRVMTWIKTFPETWDQKTWRCGTQMCFAGHACDMTGAEWTGRGFVVAEPEDDLENGVFPGSFIDLLHDVVVAATRAKRVLGLTEYEAQILFSSGNTVHDLELMVRWIKQRRESGSLTSFTLWMRMNGEHHSRGVFPQFAFDSNSEELREYAPDQIDYANEFPSIGSPTTLYGRGGVYDVWRPENVPVFLRLEDTQPMIVFDGAHDEVDFRVAPVPSIEPFRWVDETADHPMELAGIPVEGPVEEDPDDDVKDEVQEAFDAVLAEVHATVTP